MNDLLHSRMVEAANPAHKVWIFALLTALFAVLGRTVRGVTTSGALAGAAVCFAILSGAGLAGFAALLVVFASTWLATRIGYAHKQQIGAAEARSGRSASQVFANVGAAAAFALVFAFTQQPMLLLALASALAEAAADTVSSEIGQAVGRAPRLLTSWKQVKPGTDGAITATGTLAGSLAAVAVTLTCVAGGMFSWKESLVCATAGVAGMIFDSMLGATLERRGLLGNNGVNFISTGVAASAALIFRSLL